MSFRKSVKRDIHSVFLNVNEFAERRTVIYDGETFENIPVVLQEQASHPLYQESFGAQNRGLERGHPQGLFLTSTVLYCARSDLGGKLPGATKIISVSTREDGAFFQDYSVSSAGDEMGLLRLELRAVEQR